MVAVDSANKVIASYTYDAWGNERSKTETSSFTNNPLRYCGEYYDYESGMTYLRARYYDSDIKRFISEDDYWNIENMIYGDKELKEDEIRMPDINSILQSINLYVYAMNNPLIFVDPNGNVAYEHFDNLEDCLRDWTWNYYSASCYVGWETASFVYQKKDENGNWYYSYTPSLWGDEHTVDLPESARILAPGDALIIGKIHSHPNSIEGISPIDKNTYDKSVLNVYMVDGQNNDANVWQYGEFRSGKGPYRIINHAKTMPLSKQRKEEIRRNLNI